MPISRITKYLDPIPQQDDFPAILAEYINSRMECFLECLGDELMDVSRQIERPLKNVMITVHSLNLAYEEARDPMKGRKKH